MHAVTGLFIYIRYGGDWVTTSYLYSILLPIVYCYDLRYISVRLSVCLSIYLSICLSIYLSIYPTSNFIAPSFFYRIFVAIFVCYSISLSFGTT
jgi:hypothetical protein